MEIPGDGPSSIQPAALRAVGIGEELRTRLVSRIEKLGLAYGREDSFKMVRGRVLGDRILMGISTTEPGLDRLLQLADELGLPHAGRADLAPHGPLANAVFFGIEDQPDGAVCKVYLEFWDHVRQEVRRTGSAAPRLLHLGVKWHTARPGRYELARYTCHPLLSLRDILRRMAALYPPGAHLCARDAALAMVQHGAKQQPDASFLYVEVAEDNNPRHSFDINFYKTGLTVLDVAERLREAARHLSVDAALLEPQLQRLGPSLLGHLSGGIDRHGSEFLSVYAETR